jgi:hypothetical protein
MRLENIAFIPALRTHGNPFPSSRLAGVQTTLSGGDSDKEVVHKAAIPARSAQASPGEVVSLAGGCAEVETAINREISRRHLGLYDAGLGSGRQPGCS